MPMMSWFEGELEQDERGAVRVKMIRMRSAEFMSRMIRGRFA